MKMRNLVLGVALFVLPTAMPAIGPVFQSTASAAMAMRDSAQPLEAFLTDFWRDNLGVRYAHGRSGIVLNDQGSVDPISQRVANAAIGGQADSYVSLDITESGSSRPVATASFATTYSENVVSLVADPDDLERGGLAGFSHSVLAGVIVDRAGNATHVFGIAATITPVKGKAFTVFTPLGVARDGMEARQSAGDVLSALDQGPASAPQNRQAVGGGGQQLQPAPRRDCAREQQLCYDAAYATYSSCRKVSLAETVACMAACGLGCIAAGPFYPACIAACGAACLVIEAALLSACNDNLAAAYLNCDRARLECDAAVAAVARPVGQGR